MNSDQTEVDDEPLHNEKAERGGPTSSDGKEIRRGDLIGATLLSILLAALAALALWLSAPMRFGFLPSAALGATILFVSKLLVFPGDKK